MEHLVRKDVISLVRTGMTGSRGNFALAVGHFISKMKHTDRELARELSTFISKESVLRNTDAFVAAPVDIDSGVELIDVLYPVTVDTPPLLADPLKQTLTQVLKEWRNLDVLLKEGLAPARMLLFCGQPGAGKTLVAHWLAEQLNLPLLTLNLASVMSNQADKTSNNVRAVFNHAMQRPCVLLLDEVDAIAKRRDDDSDVGELKRLLNILLQAVDEWPTNSLLIAATNHGDLLDSAVCRRFDHVLEFDKPDAALISTYLADIGMADNVRDNLAALLQGESFNAIQQLILTSRKVALLDQQDLVRTLIKNAIHLRSESGGILKPDEGAMLLMYLEGHSLREIGFKFRKSHPTVGRIIKRYLGTEDEGRTASKASRKSQQALEF